MTLEAYPKRNAKSDMSNNIVIKYINMEEDNFGGISFNLF